ncbi:hypothetical protein, partial [Acinetobacter baumannii]|uniref:hypothetical protein n=1 Tax=Acinetobacter baumannii TaxID=470 RepID=UPI003BF02399
VCAGCTAGVEPDRGHEQHGAAAGRHGTDSDDADPDCAPNGCDVLPGHPGYLHGIFADRW